MAFSEEEIKQQVNVLATKTCDNPEMVYKTLANLNKALDPDLFVGADTKIVNAINKVANELHAVKTLVNDMVNKVNSVLMDVNGEENKELWEETQELMGDRTIIEGIKNILDGKLQGKLLNLKIEDEGRIVTIAKDEDGNPILKAIDLVIGDGPSTGVVGDVNVYDILYTNKMEPGITSVGEALDMILADKEVGAYDIIYTNKMEPEVKTIGEAIDNIINQINDINATAVLWENIEGKPDVANDLVMTDDAIVLMSDEDEELAQIPMTTNDDIDAIISSLDN